MEQFFGVLYGGGTTSKLMGLLYIIDNNLLYNSLQLVLLKSLYVAVDTMQLAGTVNALGTVRKAGAATNAMISLTQSRNSLVIA